MAPMRAVQGLPALWLTQLVLCSWAARPALAAAAGNQLQHQAQYPSAIAAALRQRSAGLPPTMVDPAIAPGPLGGSAAIAAQEEAPPATLLPPLPRNTVQEGPSFPQPAPQPSQPSQPSPAVVPAAPTTSDPTASASTTIDGSTKRHIPEQPATTAPPTWSLQTREKKSWKVQLSDKLWDLADVPRDPNLPVWMVPRLGPGATPNYTLLIEGWRENISRHIMESLSPCNVSAVSSNETVEVSSTGITAGVSSGTFEDTNAAIRNASESAAAFFAAQAQHGFKDVPGAVVISSLYGNFTQGIQSGALVPASSPAAAQLWAPRAAAKPGPCTTRFLCQLAR